MSSKNNLSIGIAGLGTVGMGVVETLQRDAALYQKRTGTEIAIKAISARDRNKDRGTDLSNYDWIDNTVDVADADIDVVVELVGGADGVAYDLVKKVLQNKKHVVTANKALIATHGAELAKLAEENNVILAFEAAVAGGIPILKAIREGAAANHITAVAGILNGTCNYILTAMQNEGRAFDDVLKEAQEKGYAEADPTFDVEGIDAAHKLVILTALAFGVSVNMDAIHHEGITPILAEDVSYAKDLGYHIRLLGITSLNDKGEIFQRVHPCLIPESHMLAGIEGVTNAAYVQCNMLEAFGMTGPGAGKEATASAVLADILDIARGYAPNPFGVESGHYENKPFITPETHESAFYLRMSVKDEPGVLAALTKELGEHGIGVETINQKPHQKGNVAHVIVLTYAVAEGQMEKAIDAINDLPYTEGDAYRIRVFNG